MDKESKELLLKDLCARLPYGVKVRIESDWFYDEREPYDTALKSEVLGHLIADVYSVKSYLRPISSMTNGEKEEFENLLEGIVDGIERWDKPDLCEDYDWLNAHHFDYRGLIEKGLAIEAPEGMYNLKEE